MLATFTDRKPTPVAPVFDVPDQIPWAVPFQPGSSFHSAPRLQLGNYTLQGQVSGIAEVRLIGDTSIHRVAVNYTDYSDDGKHIINGWEDVEVEILLPDFWNNKIDWYSDIIQTGVVNASKVTSPGGFHLIINAETNIFNANGTLVTTIDGVEYHQPANGS